MPGRKVLFAATSLVAAVLVATAATEALSAAGNKHPKKTPASAQRLEGTWLSNVTLENPPPGVDASFLALDTFDRDGAVLVSSSQGLPSHRSLAQGEWVRTGDGRFDCSFTWFRFDDAGKFVGTQRVRRTMTLGPNMDTFESADVVEVIAPNGAVVATLHGSETAKRLGV